MNKNSLCIIVITATYIVLIITFLTLERDPYSDVDIFEDCDYSMPCINICQDSERISDEDLLNDKFLSEKFPDADNETRIMRFPIKCNAIEKYSVLDSTDDWEFSLVCMRLMDSEKLATDGAIEHDYIYIKHSKHCIKPNNDKWIVNMCTTDHSTLNIFHHILLFIATSFMIIPMIIFASLSELRDSHGKLCIALLASQSFILAVMPLLTVYDVFSDYSFEFIIVLLYIGAFSTNFVMNAMCFDIFLTFKHFREPNYHSKYFKVVYYSFATIAVIIAFIMLFERIEIHEILFLLIVILVTSYFIFFIMILLDIFILIAALFYMAQIGKSSDTSENTRYDQEKERYWVYVKLFGILLVMWTIEMMCWMMHKSYESQIVADIIKVLSAGLIAYLLIWKPKIYHLLFQKYKSFSNDGDASSNV